MFLQDGFSVLPGQSVHKNKGNGSHMPVAGQAREDPGRRCGAYAALLQFYFAEILREARRFYGPAFGRFNPLFNNIKGLARRLPVKLRSRGILMVKMPRALLNP